MIQRIQSVYLFLSAIASAGMFFMPYSQVGDEVLTVSGYPDGSILYFYSFVVINATMTLMTLLTVFQFRNRMMQMRLCKVNSLLALFLLALIFRATDSMAGNETNVTYHAGTFLPLIQVILFLLANRSIKKDDEMVRSADRLR
jgi:predicted membrane-bound dolichyl-phosphate-mannose-protein mannosyltransferase